MDQKTILTRVKNKFDTLANWMTVWESIYPLQGEIYVFEVAAKDTNAKTAGLPETDIVRHFTKTGNGKTNVSLKDLPWDSSDALVSVDVEASGDGVINLSGQGGSNSVTISASHKKQTNISASGFTTNNTTTSISGSGDSGTLKIPQLSVDEYGHVTDISEDSVSIALPTVPNITVSPAEEGTDNTLAFGETFTTITSLSASGHTLTPTVVEFTMPSQTDISIVEETSDEQSYTPGDTITVVTDLNKTANSHELELIKTPFKLTETGLTKGDDQNSSQVLAHGDTFTAVVDTSVTNHTITDVTKTFTLPSETPLSIDTTQEASSPGHSGSITLVKSISKGDSSHNIDVVETEVTFPEETILSIDDDTSPESKPLTHQEEITVVTNIVKGDSSHNIDLVKTTFTLPSETLLSKGEDSSGAQTVTIDSTTKNGTFTAITDTQVNGHTLTDVNTTFTIDLSNFASLSDISSAMVFRGTLGDTGTVQQLPTATIDTVGDCYKVITEYAQLGYSIGDMLVCNSDLEWVLIPSGDDEYKGTVTSVATGQGLTGGPITTSGTISHASVSREDSDSTASPDHQETVTVVDSVSTDVMGHVTGINVKTVTLPSETDISVDQLSDTAQSLTHGDTFTIVTAVSKGDTSHNVDVTTKEFTLPALDTELSETSEEGVQNKVVTEAINTLSNRLDNIKVITSEQIQALFS